MSSVNNLSSREHLHSGWAALKAYCAVGIRDSHIKLNTGTALVYLALPPPAVVLDLLAITVRTYSFLYPPISRSSSHLVERLTTERTRLT